MSRFLLGTILLGAMLAMGIGCKPGTGPAVKATAKTTEAADSKHGEWWCAEHGIPESDCIMCQPSKLAEHKAKGDWCEKHDRVKSQCFKCDPTLKEKYAAVYRAKYGKEPPPPDDE